MARNETTSEAARVPARGAPGVAAVVEMLRHELEASKSVTDHIQFLRGIASGEAISPALRDHLVAHIAEEESEHQAHLARLLPALEALAATLDASTGEPGAPPPTAALTVGDLVGKRPWHARGR